ncbi:MULTISPECIES: PspA/IM30 family protein [Prochlorococcus]|uniref:PspA/IM30 family protein n=1 Tax=Prochlorococcus TaxID=1218 RepID=UPI000533816A|nr:MULTISPECIES: PspA/IM30 family protein [Prochlorococcus]KGG12964.1 Phage shock protein A [Prochlorococcus sp. MIT 0601]
MGFFERLSRFLRGNVNQVVNTAEGPGKILDQAVIDVQADLEKLRQAVAMAITSQKRLSKQADHSQQQVQVWYQRLEQAIQKGDEGLAREVLIRRKRFQETFVNLPIQIKSQEL